MFAADDKVRDHDHVTGKYRDSAHWSCNINLKLTIKIPVMFHNLKGYDSHLFMQKIGKTEFCLLSLNKVFLILLEKKIFWLKEEVKFIINK